MRRWRGGFGAIAFVLFTGIAGQHLPARAGLLAGDCASSRLKEWQAARVFAALHQELLRRRASGRIAGRRR